MDKKVGVMVGRVGSIQWYDGGPNEGKRRRVYRKGRVADRNADREVDMLVDRYKNRKETGVVDRYVYGKEVR
jgi:hypothetical protein